MSLIEMPSAPPRLAALRDPLSRQVHLLSDADRAAMEALLAPYIQDLKPVGDLELRLARSIAFSEWRLDRLRAMEDNLIALHISKNEDPALAGGNPQIADALHAASCFEKNAKAFNTLTLCETRIRRGRDHDLKQYRQLRAERRASEEAHKAAHKKSLLDAELLYCYARENNEVYDPIGESKANGGFVHEIPVLQAELDRFYKLSKGLRPRSAWKPLAKAA